MSTRRALLFSYVDRYAALAIGIATSMVIARLLTPTEVGVFSVTMVLISFTAALRDLGSGQYLVQEPELTCDRMRATWTVQLLSGLVLAIVVGAAARPVSRFYG
jgi:O-antigen/teichoic acid export membrane protein